MILGVRDITQMGSISWLLKPDDANIDHILLANKISLWTKEVVGCFSPV